MHDLIKFLFYCLNLQQMVLFWTNAFVVAGTLIIMIREHNRAKKGVKSVFASILNLSRFDWYTRFYKWILTMRSFVCHNAAPNTRNSNLLFKWAWGCLPMLNGIAFGNDFKNSNHRTLANMMSANVLPNCHSLMDFKSISYNSVKFHWSWKVHVNRVSCLT